MPSDSDFRQLLLNLEEDMSTEDRKKFVFMLSTDIPKKMREAPLFEIFEILIDRGHISETDCTYLLDVFDRIKLPNLSFTVARFVTQRSPPTISENTQPIEGVHLSNILTTENSRRQNPTEEEFLNDYNADDSMIISDYGQNSPTNLTPTIDESEPAIISLSVENIDLRVFKSESWSEEFLQNINVNIPPREYQRELVQSAIQARNTIICLRTGGGKTFVAALLLKYYLIKKMSLSNENDKKFLAFFIVPRRAMLKQQLEKLKQIGNLRIAACDEGNDPKQYINNYDIIICTPQKLLNCLKAKMIFLSNIDVLCFDECHDSVVRNQYIGIMQYLMCTKVDHIPPVDPLPIIIGLTAAAGLHGSNSSSIIQSLTLLCARFNCLTITTVSKKENEEELEQYVNHISEDEIICIDKQKAFDSLRSSIEKELKYLICDLFAKTDTNPHRIFPVKDFDMNGYEQNLELLKQSEQKKQHFSFVVLIDYILPIYRHIKALIDLTPELVLSDLKDYFEITYKKREHPIDIDTLIYQKCQNLIKKKLTELEESQQILSNPKLDKLVELLKKQAEKSNSRTLILVERKFYAKKICEYLQNHAELKNIIKSCWLIGHNGADFGKSNTQEDPTLKDFQTGTCNVMISTDVVQAGLDIPQCSLVLRYDFVPDSIGSVQARVRARAVDCQYCLITAKDSLNYTKELDNRQREHDLKEALDAWKRFPFEQFQERVKEKQEWFITEWNQSLTKALISQASIPKDNELKGEVLCRACGHFLGNLARLRQHVESYFVDDDDFYNRIEEKLLPERREYVKTTVTGETLCGNKKCRAELGSIKILKDYPKNSPIYPLKCKCIKIRQIEKENEEGTVNLETKWTKMPFKIPPFELLCTDNNGDIFYDANDTLPSDL